MNQRFRPLRISALAAAILCLLVLAPGRFSVAQDQKPPALPLPEMQKLSKLYVGTWNYTESYPKSAAAPNGLVNTGVYTSELGPGGNSIINRFHSKGPAGDAEGVLVMTWDPAEKAYKEYTLGDSFPAVLVQNGQWEGEALVYRTELSMGGKKIALRNVTKFLDGGKLTSDEFASSNGSAEALFVHVEAVKQ